MQLYFYELHEGATDLMTEALLVSERHHEAAEFEALVRTARKTVLDTFEEDTLVEAIAGELERSHAFTYIDDKKLQASMSVGVEEIDTFSVEPTDEFRSMVVELDGS